MDTSSLQYLGFLALPILIINYYRGRLGSRYQLEVSDEQLLIKPCSVGYLSKSSTRVIDINKVAKLQKTKDAITFFYQSGHAIDIWHRPTDREIFWLKLIHYFPNAEIAIIDKE
ncbi:hypothetical protein ACOYR1_14730 [Thalassotalea piscium]